MDRIDALYNLKSLSEAIEATKEAFEISSSISDEENSQVKRSLTKAFYEVRKLHSDLKHARY